MEPTPKLQLRISSGTAKNKKLVVPEIPDFRPAQEVVKQAIFAILADKILNAVCLDLFAGSGNLGIEALSRGASYCDFVDSHPEAERAIAQNLFNCGFTDRAQVIGKESAKFAVLAKEDKKNYDVIFMDPFYKDTNQVFLLKQIAGILKKDGFAIFLYGRELIIDAIINDTELGIVTTRRFGATYFSVLKHQKLAK